MNKNSGKYILKIKNENGEFCEQGCFKNYDEIKHFLRESDIILSIDQIRRIKKGFYKRENIKNKSCRRSVLLNYEICCTKDNLDSPRKSSH